MSPQVDPQTSHVAGHLPEMSARAILAYVSRRREVPLPLRRIDPPRLVRNQPPPSRGGQTGGRGRGGRGPLTSGRGSEEDGGRRDEEEV